MASYSGPTDIYSGIFSRSNSNLLNLPPGARVALSGLLRLPLLLTVVALLLLLQLPLLLRLLRLVPMLMLPMSMLAASLCTCCREVLLSMPVPLVVQLLPARARVPEAGTAMDNLHLPLCPSGRGQTPGFLWQGTTGPVRAFAGALDGSAALRLHLPLWPSCRGHRPGFFLHDATEK